MGDHTDHTGALGSRPWSPPSAATPGVIGVRLTGAGFGGCVVALGEPGTDPPSGHRWWWVPPSAGATYA